MVYVDREGHLLEKPPLTERIQALIVSLWLLACLLVTTFLEPFVDLSSLSFRSNQNGPSRNDGGFRGGSLGRPSSTNDPSSGSSRGYSLRGSTGETDAGSRVRTFAPNGTVSCLVFWTWLSLSVPCNMMLMYVLFTALCIDHAPGPRCG
jgi:hypothetical protein